MLSVLIITGSLLTIARQSLTAAIPTDLRTGPRVSAAINGGCTCTSYNVILPYTEE